MPLPTLQEAGKRFPAFSRAVSQGRRDARYLYMTDNRYLSPAILHQRREQVVEALTEHFAHDHLDEVEFENRLDRAYQATALVELEALTADLPAVPVTGTTAPAPAGGVDLAHAHEARERQFVLAIMGGTERKGVWTPARNIEVVAMMGGVDLDFREARFPPGVTQINALAIMGGIDILVPPGLRVECSGIGIMGAFEGRDNRGRSSHPDSPVLKINGLALMGAVEVHERMPGESGRDAKRRRREERRRLQRGDRS